MRKYDSYKPTKIEFLDEIPEHWEEKRMRFLGYLYGGLSGKSATDFNQLTNENNKYFIPFTNIANNFRIDPESLQTVVISENENQNTVQKGDLFFLMSSENYDDVGKSAVLLDDLEETYLNSFCKGFRITKDDIVPKFLNYQLHSKQLRHNLLTGANGFTRINLKIDKVIDLLTALPTPEEQTSIAAYLDRKTAEIDELIADKKRLLELYEEEKTAIINQAVTKGINPDSPMKDSGIEWLGEIPEHWDTVNFNHYVFLRHGYQFRNFDFTSTGIKVIKITQLKASGELEVNDVSYISEDRLDEFRDILIVEGDILMALTGGTIGKIIRAPKIEEPLLQNYRVGNFFPKNDLIIKDFLFWVLSSDLILKQIFYDQRETGQPNIGKEDFGRMFFVLPSSTNEQDKIVEFIKSEINRIDAKKAKTKKLIDLLTEYRTALISEVVTGKIKVIE